MTILISSIHWQKCLASIVPVSYTHLVIEEFNDYVIPNTAVEDGSLDANYFQHQAYLDQFNEEQGTHLVSVASIHYEPCLLYTSTGSNFLTIYVCGNDQQITITSVLDNLGKGASGAAVQNMNIALGLNEELSLI